MMVTVGTLIRARVSVLCFKLIFYVVTVIAFPIYKPTHTTQTPKLTRATSTRVIL